MKAPVTFEHRVNAMLEEETKRLEEAVLRGACADHASYRWYVGQITALRSVKVNIQELFNEFREQG